MNKKQELVEGQRAEVHFSCNLVKQLAADCVKAAPQGKTCRLNEDPHVLDLGLFGIYNYERRPGAQDRDKISICDL